MLSPNFTPFPQIETNRLLLRQMTLADTPAVQRLRSNEAVMQYINRPLTHTLEEASYWVNVIISALERNEGITWCISLKERPAEHVGSIGLWRIDKENHRAEIGYMLEPFLQGKGIMYEAIQPMLEYGFKVLKLHSIEAQIDPRNRASAALLKKAGFVQEAYFKENYFVRGAFADTAVYSLLTPYKEEAIHAEYEDSALQNIAPKVEEKANVS
ncbi:MAG TPA: GNAT family protein [Flavisolibacter sp.]|jgi:ribosomal-protein-alanine N-acetyltransferase|nr:GNAT family protein [Flavisolibacter sp.]